MLRDSRYPRAPCPSRFEAETSRPLPGAASAACSFKPACSQLLDRVRGTRASVETERNVLVCTRGLRRSLVDHRPRPRRARHDDVVTGRMCPPCRPGRGLHCGRDGATDGGATGRTADCDPLPAVLKVALHSPAAGRFRCRRAIVPPLRRARHVSGGAAYAVCDCLVSCELKIE